MTRAKPGRPRSDRARVSRKKILEAALAILDAGGPESLSMRSLAQRLKVNPMTLYHHVGNRSELLCAVSDMVYGEICNISNEDSRSIRERIQLLLTSYYEAVKKHPQLSLTIFSTPDAFSLEAKRITQKLVDLLRLAKLSSAQAQVWLAILVDYTHGSSIATAMGCTHPQRDDEAIEQARLYYRGLEELLDCLFQVSGR